MTTRDEPDAIPALGQSLTKRSLTTGDRGRVFAALESEWKAMATGAAAWRAMQSWATIDPAFDSFSSPAELVAAITRIGDPARSCALLGELLVIADTDVLAARAVLQAIVPGLRRAARQSWKPTTPGPWTHADDVAADAVSAGWAAIRVHAGQRHDRPAAIIIRVVEGQLRRTHDAWRRQTMRTEAMSANSDALSQSGLDAARTGPEQAAALITAANRTGVLDRTQAGLLFATGVLGYTVTEAGRTMGADGNAAYRSLERARALLRAWVEDRSDVVTPRSGAVRSVPSRRPAPFPTGAVSERALVAYDLREDAAMTPLLVTPLEAARLLGVSRSKVYALLKAGAIDSVTIDACRRIPHDDLIAYVERLRHRRELNPHAS